MVDNEELPAPGPHALVTLREVTADTLGAITDLKVKPTQEIFVAPNANSIAEAYFEPKAWFRAIYADETPVGFAMLYDDTDAPEYFLWRFMIDGQYQHLGYGQRALQLVTDYVRTRPGAREFLLSYVEAEGGPEAFYERCGFVKTGKFHDEEAEMKLEL